MVDTLHTHTKPLRTLMLVSVRRFPNIARQGDPVDLRCRLGARHLGLKPLQPPHHRCNTNGKPGRHLGYCKPFLLSHRENLTAKIKGVCHAPNIIILCGMGDTRAPSHQCPPAPTGAPAPRPNCSREPKMDRSCHLESRPFGPVHGYVSADGGNLCPYRDQILRIGAVFPVDLSSLIH